MLSHRIDTSANTHIRMAKRKRIRLWIIFMRRPEMTISEVFHSIPQELVCVWNKSNRKYYFFSLFRIPLPVMTTFVWLYQIVYNRYEFVHTNQVFLFSFWLQVISMFVAILWEFANLSLWIFLFHSNKCIKHIKFQHTTVRCVFNMKIVVYT